MKLQAALFVLVIQLTECRVKPRLDQTASFSDFFIKKWNRLARNEQLKDWDTSRTDKYAANLAKLKNKIVKGTENCRNLIEKAASNETDTVETNSELRRKRRSLEENRAPLRSMMSDFQRSAMHEFHKKISTKSQQTATAGSYLRKAGKRSTPASRLTHILLKFRQLIDFGIKECAHVYSHENLTKRYNKLISRRNHLHQLGSKHMAKVQATKQQSK